MRVLALIFILASSTAHARTCPTPVLIIDSGFMPHTNLERGLGASPKTKRDKINFESNRKRTIQLFEQNRGNTDIQKLVLGQGSHGHTVLKEATQGLGNSDVTSINVDLHIGPRLPGKPVQGDPKDTVKPDPWTRRSLSKLALDVVNGYRSMIELAKPRPSFVNFSFHINLLGDTQEDKEFMRSELQRHFGNLFRSFPDVVFVAAAGNEGSELSKAPNSYHFSGIDAPNLTIVGSVDDEGKKSNFSNYGKGVDIYMNGENVPVSSKTLYKNPFKRIGAKTFEIEGTSFASPRFLNLLIKHHRLSNPKCSSQSPPLQSLQSLMKQIESQAPGTHPNKIVEEFRPERPVRDHRPIHRR